jgi:hypothetical protein
MSEGQSKGLTPPPGDGPESQGIGATSKDLPRSLPKEIAACPRKLNRHHHALFTSDRAYRKRVGQFLTALLPFLTALLPPKPKRRGRPGILSVTKAIALKKKFRREHPGKTPEQLWRWIYPEAIPNYDAMSEVQKHDARAELRARVKDRIKKQNRSKKRKRQARRSKQGGGN